LELYRHRWGIERVFQQITEVYHLRTLIASTPQGTIFQCAFCLLLYNLVVVQRSYVAQAQQRERESISLENLFYDARRQ
jgi:IS4 transposase